MKKLMVALMVVAIASLAQAAVLATWNFNGSNSTDWQAAAPIAGADLLTGVASASLSFGSTFTATSSANGLRGNGITWGGISRVIALTDTSFVQIDLTASSGYTLTVESIDGIFSGSGTGVGGQDRWAANSNGGAYSFVIGAATTANGSRSFDITDTSGASVGLRYFNSPTATGGSYGFYSSTTANDGIVVNGTATQAIPEPATMGLLGLGALAMVLRRKMK